MQGSIALRFQDRDIQIAHFPAQGDKGLLRFHGSTVGTGLLAGPKGFDGCYSVELISPRFHGSPTPE